MAYNVDANWLSGLSAGDTWVAVIPYRNVKIGGRITSVKVLKVTATQILVQVGEEERRYRRKDGRPVGDVWSECIPTPAPETLVAVKRAENRHLNMSRSLAQCNFQQLPFDTVEAMYKLMTAATSGDVKPDQVVA